MKNEFGRNTWGRKGVDLSVTLNLGFSSLEVISGNVETFSGNKGITHIYEELTNKPFSQKGYREKLIISHNIYNRELTVLVNIYFGCDSENAPEKFPSRSSLLVFGVGQSGG